MNILINQKSKTVMKIFLGMLIVATSLLICSCSEQQENSNFTDAKEQRAEKENINAIEGEAVEEPYTVVEHMPVFGDTPMALNEYIVSNLIYPLDAKKNGIQGTVYISFTVCKTGKVKDVKVDKSVNKLLDEEAVRIISTMPDWQPGYNNNKSVDVKMVLPLKFSLT